MDRRSFLKFGLVTIASPAIVRASSLMQIKVFEPPLQEFIITGTSNGLLTIDEVTQEAVKLWQKVNSTLFIPEAAGFRIGDIITISGVHRHDQT